MGIKTTLRSLRRNPGFTITALVVLALGIGANTAIFSIVRAVLLKPLPYNDPGRIMVVAETNRRGRHISVSGADFDDWRKQATSFEAIASYGAYPMTVFAGGRAERVGGAVVNQGWFRVMGVQPKLGRLFDPSEEKPNAQRAVVISENLWRRSYGESRQVLGEKLKLEGELYTIVGVLPAGFRFPDKTDAWVPLALFPDGSSRSAHNYDVLGRLKAGVTVAAAEAEMKTIAARLEAQYPESNEHIGAAVTPLQADLTNEARPTLYLLLAAVAFVLLIACANVGNLLLARGARRRSELAIRAALGAGRWRLARQLLGESLMLALAGGALGLPLAWWAKDLLVALAPSSVPGLAGSRIDFVVFGFSVAVSVATGVLFGLIPAWDSARTDLTEALKAGNARSGLGGSGALARSVLVCAEIALSVVLVTGAGLALRSLVGLRNAPRGFDSSNVLALDVSVPASDDAGRKHAIRVFEEFLRQAETVPGVVSAGAVTSVPLSADGSSNGGFVIDGGKMEKSQWAGFHTVGRGYFRTLSIPMRAGRDFDARDQVEAPRVAVVSEKFVQQYFPRGDAVGHRISTGYDNDSMDMTIVGVVGDVRHIGLSEAPRPEIYVPFTQHPVRAPQLSVVVKTKVDPASVIEPLRTELRRIDPEAPVEFGSFDAVIDRSVGSPRFRAVLLAAFAMLALLLAVLGVYGLMSYLAAQRTPEIGLRMALGATAAGIVALVLGRSMRLIGIGLGVGLVASLALTRYMQSMLYGVKATDPLTYAVVCVALAGAALAASYIPAWRASRVDPVTALRSE